MEDIFKQIGNIVKPSTNTLEQLIKRHGISQSHLAREMHIPRGTFKNKLADNQPLYHFTEKERALLVDILKEIGVELLGAK